MSQRNNNNNPRQRRPPVPHGVPRNWQTFEAQLAANPAVDEDSPFLTVQRPQLNMPTQGEARSVANFSNGSDLRLGASGPLSTYPPLPPFSRTSDLRGYPYRQSLLQEDVNVRSTTSSASRTSLTLAPRTPGRTLFQPPSLDRYSPYTLDAAEEDLQRRINTRSSPTVDGADDLERRSFRERRGLISGVASMNRSAQHAGMNPRVPPGLVELQRHALARETLLERLRRRTQAMPMPRARVEHFTPIPAINTVEDPERPICMEDYDDSEHCAIRLQNVDCDHVFGRSCIQEWVNSEMRNAHRCPSCRRTIGGALVDDQTGFNLPRQQDLAHAAEVRRQMEYFQASLAPTYPNGNSSGPLQTPRATPPSRVNTRETFGLDIQEARARRRDVLNGVPADQRQSQLLVGHSGPSSSPPAPTPPRTPGRLPQQADPPALSTQQRLARIQRNIAAMTGERRPRISANMNLAMPDPARPTTQDLQTMIDQREEEMRDLHRQIEAARITIDGLRRHHGEEDEEELQMFRRALGYEE